MIKEFKKVAKNIKRVNLGWIIIITYMMFGVSTEKGEAFISEIYPGDLTKRVINPAEVDVARILWIDPISDIPGYIGIRVDIRRLTDEEKFFILNRAAGLGLYISYNKKGDLGRVVEVRGEIRGINFFGLLLFPRVYYLVYIQKADGRGITVNLNDWDGAIYQKVEEIQDTRPTLNDPFPKELLPELLEVLISVESSGNPFAYNPQSGASGLTQITPSAWEDLRRVYPDRYGGLKYPRDIFNPDVARQAGLDYLKIIIGYLETYGLPATLPYILTAYNWGIGNVRSYGIGKAPQETKNYTSKIISLLIEKGILRGG